MAIRDTVHEMAEQAKEKGGSAKAAIARSVAEASQSTSEAMHQAVESGKSMASEAGGRLSEQAGYWKEKGLEQVDVLRGTVQRNALTSAVIAFAVGFVLARLVMRR
jgi:hypothetical protein